MRNIIALLLIVASIGIFFGYIQPSYGTIQGMWAKQDSYNGAIDQVNTLKETIAQRQKTLSGFSADDLAKLNKFLPSSIDNVRLIIDINNIASNFGLAIKGITLDRPDTASAPVQTVANQNGYNSVTVSFDVVATYSTFLSFIQGLEKSLRLVDIVSISFSPTTGNSTATYDYHITLRTDWLK